MLRLKFSFRAFSYRLTFTLLITLIPLSTQKCLYYIRVLHTTFYSLYIFSLLEAVNVNVCLYYSIIINFTTNNLFNRLHVSLYILFIRYSLNIKLLS